MVTTRFGCPACHAVLQLTQLPPTGAKIRCPQCSSLFDAVVRPPSSDSGIAQFHEPEAQHQPTMVPPPPSTRRLKAKETEQAPVAPPPSAHGRKMPQSIPTPGPRGSAVRKMPQPIPTPARTSGSPSGRMPKSIPTATPAQLRAMAAASPVMAPAPPPPEDDEEVDLAAPSAKPKKKKKKVAKSNGGKRSVGLIIGCVVGGCVVVGLVTVLIIWLAGSSALAQKDPPVVIPSRPDVKSYEDPILQRGTDGSTTTLTEDPRKQKNK